MKVTQKISTSTYYQVLIIKASPLKLESALQGPKCGVHQPLDPTSNEMFGVIMGSIIIYINRLQLKRRLVLYNLTFFFHDMVSDRSFGAANRTHRCHVFHALFFLGWQNIWLDKKNLTMFTHIQDSKLLFLSTLNVH